MTGDMNLIDLVLIDHKTLKTCIDDLKDGDANKMKKLSSAKIFLATLKKHSEAEKKVIYAQLETNEELRPGILEGEIEHGIADAKVKLLMPRVARVTTLSEELEAELKVLAEIVNHHIKEEESALLPNIQSELDEDELLMLGKEFKKVRQFTKSELKEVPELSAELKTWMMADALSAKKYAKKIGEAIKGLSA
jgi:hemerythrin-like domain-containing protein